ncbi:MAG TPA: hypothetical protein VG269_26370 [Tepidisphaeraceae bacterium]|jgi:hypothetical protein|nr:hypothetical protein [Tepidisphaeraceae bacterium]
MGIEDLKRWHWAVLGAALGLSVAYVLIGIGTDQLVAGSRAITVAPKDFETYLHEPPVLGYPRTSHVRVYPNGDLLLLSFEHLVPLSPSDPRRAARHLAPDDHRAWEYLPCVLNSHAPYQPQTDPLQTVDVVARPVTRTQYVNSDTRPVPGAEFSGWAGNAKDWRDPGGASSVTLHLMRADYQLNVSVPGKAAENAADLSARFNGHALPPFAAATPRLLRSTISAADFAPGETQLLELSRKDRPLQVDQLQFLNTHYTVLDYLRAAAAKNPAITYRYGWWAGRSAMLTIGTLSGLLVIGGIWPSVLNLLLGAGFGRQKNTDPDYDLSRFKGEQQKAPKVSAGAAREQVEAMEARLDAELKEMESEVAAKAAPVSQKPQEKPVRTLDASPMETAATKPATPGEKEFTGEFYPVARGPAEKK